jgi:3-hydroxyacyl-CoA dehydrogenase
LLAPLRRVAVLGAGTMGAQIAALFANAGVPVLLLDIAPEELTPGERQRGLTLNDREVRTRFAAEGLRRARQMKPAAFTLPDRAELVSAGALDDDLPRLAECDWVVEAVVEDLEIKRSLLARVERYRRPDTVVSTNTSGLPVHDIAEGRSDDFQAHFLGTHFFNPPRYLPLLEVIPALRTDAGVAGWIAETADRVLGKSVVRAKDTPNFIANRLGTFGFLHAVRAMLEEGLKIEEVDDLTGPLLGRPRSATFRTVDIVGLDVLADVAGNAFQRLPAEEHRELYRLPAFMQEMLQRGWLGEKTGGGFYRRQDGEILALDYEALEYRPRQKSRLPVVEAVRNLGDFRRRVTSVLGAGGPAARFLWRTIAGSLVYAAQRIPEIADDIPSVDRAMRWGFGWELGPFEVWDALGVADVASRLQRAQVTLPPLVLSVLAEGAASFYRRRAGALEAFDPLSREYRAVSRPAAVIVLAERKPQAVVATNPGASLVDLGDGIGCVELHSKMNAIGEDTMTMVRRALREAGSRFDALVISAQGRDFSVGANLVLLLLEAQDENWDELDLAVRGFQQVNRSIRYCARPVVAAPFGRVLGGGCEIVLHAARAQAAIETYMGFVETGVGLIPAGGGTGAMARRMSDLIPEDIHGDLAPLIRRAFENIALGRVATSAEECRRLGYLRECDGISLNAERLIGDAKQIAAAMAKTGHRPPLSRRFRVGGERVRAALDVGVQHLQAGGHISDYDAHIARKLAYVITGGDVPEGAWVTEEHVLDLEREAFLSLLGEAKTQQRIRHLLDRGRPLRN